MRREPTIGVLRRTIILVTLVTLLLLMSAPAMACGASDSPGTPVGSDSLTGSLTVSAASSLQGAFTDIEAAFERVHPRVNVAVNFGASSTLAQQIIAGAPVDVFASADEANMGKVSAEELVDGAPAVFATNSLAIIVSRGNAPNLSTLTDLARPGLVYVTCASDVPIGKYGAQVLQRAGVTVKPASLEPDVKSIVAKVASGEADAGIVYATDVTATKGAAVGIAIPPESNVTVSYPIAPISSAHAKEAARAWIAFVLGPEGQQILRQYGFGAS